MKAMIYARYGGPEQLKMAEVEKPIPGEGEVLVKVHASSINAADWRLLMGDPVFVRLFSGLFKPRFSILGKDFSGTVEAVGKGVREFTIGDEVYGEKDVLSSGTFAEFVCVKPNRFIKKPPTMSFEEAATIPLAGLTALQALRDAAKVERGSRVLLLGGSGGVGIFAIQIAKYLGAEVSTLCSTRNVELAKKLGSNKVYDYKKQSPQNIEGSFDAILSINGGYPFSLYKQLLKEGGRAVLVGGINSQFFKWMFFSKWHSWISGKKFLLIDMKFKREDLVFLGKMKEENKLRTIIDKTYPLSKLEQGLNYMLEKHCQGKVVITPVEEF